MPAIGIMVADDSQQRIHLTLRLLSGREICVAEVSPDACCQKLLALATEALGLPGAVEILGKDGPLPENVRIGEHFVDRAEVQVVFAFDQDRADQELIGAIEGGAEASVRRLLGIGASADAVDDDYRRVTVLHKASVLGHAAVAELLLKHGADVHAATKMGETALHNGAWHGHEDVAAVLLRHGADAEARNLGGQAPLHHAARRGHRAAAELLLRHGAGVNTTTSTDCMTPLHMAAAFGHAAVAGMLLDHKADASKVECLSKQTPLGLAERHRRCQVVELLRGQNGLN